MSGKVSKNTEQSQLTFELVIAPDQKSSRLLCRSDHDSGDSVQSDITSASLSCAPSSPGPGSTQVPTMAAVIESIRADQTIPVGRRQEVVSSLRTVCRALRLEPINVPAHPEFIREGLKGFVPSMLDRPVKEGRWRNVQSHLRFALDHLGLNVQGRYREPLAADWTHALTLFDALPKPHGNKKRFGILKLAKFCSRQGIGLAHVDDAVLERFKQDLEQTTTSGSPRDTHRTACVIWNFAADAFADWPRNKVTVPDYRRTYALPWTTFPESLRKDADAFLAHLAGTDILDGHDFKPLRPSSIKCHALEIQEFVSALVHRGRDPKSIAGLRDIVELKAAKDGLRFFLERTPGKKLQACRMAGTLLMIARHWVHAPEADLDELRKMRKRLNDKPKGMTPKNATRLMPLENATKRDALLNLPQSLADKVLKLEGESKSEKKKGRVTTAFQRALIMQSAVALEILIMAPLRIENLSELEIDRHLIRVGDGDYRIFFLPEEVKNDVELEIPLPRESAELIDDYIRHHRPHLTKGTGRWLFPGRKAAKVSACLGRQICKAVKVECGIILNPHLFRHLAAFIHLAAHPGDYGTVMRLHGHKSMQTTIDYYCGPERKAAFEHFDQVIADLRRGSRDEHSKRQKPVSKSVTSHAIE